MAARIIPVLLFLLSLVTVLSLQKSGYFSMHDDLQVVRGQQMDLCWRDFQLPCRWVPDMGYGYGYPQFNYYGPLPYYVQQVFHIFGFSYIDSAKLTFTASFILAAFSMYLLGRYLWGMWPGFLTSAAYIFAPYRSSDLYSRGAMGEMWAFVFMPLILYCLHRLFDQPDKKHQALLAMAVAGLLTTHNVSSLVFLPLVAIYGFYLLSVSSSKKKLIKKSIISVIWGVGIASFFFLPVIFEKSFAHTESMISGYFNYLAHFVTLKQLFLSTFWSYGSSQIGPTDDMSFFLGPIQLFLAVISIFIAIKRRHKLSLLIFGLFLISVFMNHSKSTFIWQALPFLEYLQFPWRFLVSANFFLCLLAGYSLSTIKKDSQKIPVLIFSLILLFFNLAFFTPQNWFRLTDNEKLTGMSWDKQMTISIFDYLPTTAKFPPSSAAPIFPRTLDSAKLSIMDFKHTSNSFSFVAISNKDTTIELPQLDFPNWLVKVDNQKIDHSHDKDSGLITFSLPSGSHHVSVKFVNTPIRTLGSILTFVSFSLAVYYIFLNKHHA